MHDAQARSTYISARLAKSEFRRFVNTNCRFRSSYLRMLYFAIQTAREWEKKSRMRKKFEAHGSIQIENQLCRDVDSILKSFNFSFFFFTYSFSLCSIYQPLSVAAWWIGSLLSSSLFLFVRVQFDYVKVPPIPSYSFSIVFTNRAFAVRSCK